MRARVRLPYAAGASAEASLAVVLVACVGAASLAHLGHAHRSAIAGAAPGSSAPDRRIATDARPTHAVAAAAAASTAIAALVRAADETLIEARPAGVAAKYARMAESPTLFHRGTILLFLADWLDGRAAETRFRHDPLVLSPGDAHPGNFGLLRGADGRLRLEPNDFDTIGRYPYLWDLRRLAVGLRVALSEAGARAETTDGVLRAAVAGYLEGVTGDVAAGALEASKGFPTRDLSGGRSVPEQYLRRGGAELRRGGVGDQSLEALAGDAYLRLDQALATYAAALPVGVPTPVALLDAAMLAGKGVSSLPVERALTLVEYAHGERRVLEVKEIIPRASMFAFEGAPPGRREAAILDDRIRRSFAHGASGVEWRVVEAGDGASLVRPLHPKQRSLKFERWAPSHQRAAVRLARGVGRSLGVVHSRDAALTEFLGDLSSKATERFVREQMAFAHTYGRRLERALVEFRAAVRAHPLLAP